MVYPKSKYRVSSSLFDRDYQLEKKLGIDDLRIYAYLEDDNLHVVGEIIASSPPPKRFTLVCEIYDTDEDILKTINSNSYGEGYNFIKTGSFFNGFPFTIDIYGYDQNEISSIRLLPELLEYEEDE